LEKDLYGCHVRLGRNTLNLVFYYVKSSCSGIPKSRWKIERVYEIKY